MISDELARLIKDGYNALGELEFTESSNRIPSLPLGRQEFFD